jgi:hypothetical protein
MAELVRRANLLVTAHGERRFDSHWEFYTLTYNFDGLMIIKRLHDDRPIIHIRNGGGRPDQSMQTYGTYMECDLPMTYEEKVKTSLRRGPVCPEGWAEPFLENLRKDTLLEELADI